MKNIARKWLQKVVPDNAGERDKWIKFHIDALTPDSRVLDAGAGEQRLRKWCNKVNYVSQDFGKYEGDSEDSLQTPEFDYGELDITSDITAIPEADGSFDAILCIEVIEHVPYPVAAVKELSRLLRPGGTLILSAPFASFTHMAPYHFSTGFTRYWYEKHLVDAGMKIEEITSNGSFFEYLIQELHRSPFVYNQYAKKKMGILKRAAVFIQMVMLRSFVNATQRSSELSCFGWQIKATKVEDQN